MCHTRTCHLSPACSSRPQAKLQKHIQNPSAAELVHFLFGPLDLVTGVGAGWDWGNRLICHGFGVAETSAHLSIFKLCLSFQEAAVPP